MNQIEYEDRILFDHFGDDKVYVENARPDKNFLMFLSICKEKAEKRVGWLRTKNGYECVDLYKKASLLLSEI